MTTQSTEPPPSVDVRQYTAPQVVGVVAAAAVPMALLAWVIAPAVASSVGGLAVALVICLTAGLVWQGVLVLVLVWREQRTLRWSVVSKALWLVAPTRRGVRSGRLWWMLVPFIVGFALLQLVPYPFESPADRTPAFFLSTAEGHDLISGNIGLYVLFLILFVFNTALGEELLFRGLLLPRMRGAFGRWDWVANGILFGLYHLHQPWSIVGSVVDGALTMALPSALYRSAWFGIIVHSTQSVLFGVLITVAFAG